MTDQATICGQCGEALEPGFAFCTNCGAAAAPAKLECVSCGQELKPAWKACPYCGTRVGGSPPVRPTRESEPGVPEGGRVPDGCVALSPTSRWYPKTPHPDQVAEAQGLGLALAIEHIRTGIPLILIPGGEFQMGACPNDKKANESEKPRHAVLLSPYYMGASPVTRKQFLTRASSDPSHFKDGKSECPVEQVSWDDVQVWLRRAGDGLSLPTEAQWERAARGGTETVYWWGDAYRARMANCDERSLAGGKFPRRTTPVGSYPANPYGLCDVLGNVWEWCEDWYDAEYYFEVAKPDPSGPGNGEYRVLRGGSWINDPWCLRASYRYWQHSRLPELQQRLPCGGPHSVGVEILDH